MSKASEQTAEHVDPFRPQHDRQPRSQASIPAGVKCTMQSGLQPGLGHHDLLLTQRAQFSTTNLVSAGYLGFRRPTRLCPFMKRFTAVILILIGTGAITVGGYRALSEL